MKSHRIMADLGKTGAAFFLCGRPQPVTASSQGTSCINLHTRQDDRLTDPRGLPHPTSADSGELCPAGSGARPLSFSTLPSGRGASAARVPRGCRPDQPAARVRVTSGRTRRACARDPVFAGTCVARDDPTVSKCHRGSTEEIREGPGTAGRLTSGHPPVIRPPHRAKWLFPSGAVSC